MIIRRKDRERDYEALRSSDEGDITLPLGLIVERIQDGLRRNDRARMEVAGLSLALQRIREHDQRRYRIWADAIRLLGSTRKDLARPIEHKSNISMFITSY